MDTSEVIEQKHCIETSIPSFTITETIDTDDIEKEEEHFHPNTITRCSNRATRLHVYDLIAKFLLPRGFYLTALEFYTEILENGYDLPYLREFFADSTQFDNTMGSKWAFRKLSNGHNELSPINGENDDSLSRILSKELSDTVSMDNLTVYSKDIPDNFHGGTEGTESTSGVDEPLSLALSNVSVSPTEQQILNYAINQYLLSKNYKLTSVTFTEENESTDCNQWNRTDADLPLLPDLVYLYRSYCHQLYLEAHKPVTEDFSMSVNFDVDRDDHLHQLQTTLEQTQSDLFQTQQRIKQIEEDNRNLNQQISSFKHENKNLLLQLQQLENRLLSDSSTSDTLIDESRELDCSRLIPAAYRQAFERQISSQENQNQSSTNIEQTMVDELICQLQSLSLDQHSLLDLIQKIIIKWHSVVTGTTRMAIIPLLISTVILHPKSNTRQQLLRLMFNLCEAPNFEQRKILAQACLCFARQSTSMRIHTELFPQLWEDLCHEHEQQRYLVAEVSGRLVAYVTKEIRVSLIFSLLEQMLVDDESDQVRSICCRYLSLVLQYIDDSSRLPQCLDLLDRCLADTAAVVQSARDFLLPSIAMWCLELNNLHSMLIDHFLLRMEASCQKSPVDHRTLLQSISILTDLTVFMFSSILKSFEIDDSLLLENQELRSLPNVRHLESHQLRLILSPDGDRLVQCYDYSAAKGEFSWANQQQAHVDDFLRRSFHVMNMIDVYNEPLIHACSELIKTISGFFGRTFWQLKIKPVYTVMDFDRWSDNNSYSEAAFVLYATGVLSSWKTEQEQAELTHYLYNALLLLNQKKVSIDALKMIYTELGSHIDYQDQLLNVLRDSLMNTNPQIRWCTLQLFHCMLPSVSHSIISSKILPAMITLASDDQLSIRAATIPVFGAILVHCSEAEVLERVYSQFHIFDSDPIFRHDHHIQCQLIETFSRIAANVETKFREDFILPYLAFITAQNSPEMNDDEQNKRRQLLIRLFEAYSALSCCSHSDQSVLNSFLPGLYCLRMEFTHYRPESVSIIDSIIQDLENQLEQSLASIGQNHVQQDNVRGRMLKGLGQIRDSTGIFTYRWMKRK